MDLILPSPAQPTDTRHPRIGYRCVAETPGATITADSTAAGFAAANAFDWRPYTYWKPATTGSHYIQIVTPEPVKADYLAIAYHNLAANGGTIKAQYSIDAGSTWHDLIDAFAPIDRKALWFDFAEAEADHWRIVIDSDPASAIAVISLGLKYLPYRGQFSGFTPPGLARSFDLYGSTSETGVMLGRSILRQRVKGTITFDLMELQDAYQDWGPFMDGAQQHPFFLVWMLADWPDDVQYVQTNGDWTPPAMSQFGFMATTLNYIGQRQL